MQYSRYCRCPAAKAGRAEHEISRPERFHPRKDENLPERQVRELRASPDANLMGAAALAPSSLVRQRGNRRRKGKEQEGFAPSNSAAGEVTCTPANRFAVFEKL